ncbi:hypothetical protein LTS18_014921, partial [Coniosporium uncinatum]
FQQRFGIESVAEFFNSTEGVFALLNVSKGDFLTNAVGHHGALIRSRTHNLYVPVSIDHDTGAILRDPKTGFATRSPYATGGEILVRVQEGGPSFAGYWNNDAATSSKFERDVFVKGDLYYRTGDALRRDADGRWYFLDRLGDTYRWKSENVATAEVAEAMGSFPGVTEAIVYGVLVPGHDGRAGMATLILSDAIDQKQLPIFMKGLMKHCRAKLPRYAIPVFVRIARGQGYVMHNNKTDKKPLKREAFDLDMVYGEGKGAEEAFAEGKDLVLWWPRGLGAGEDEWTIFGRSDWEGVKGGGKEVSVKL